MAELSYALAIVLSINAMLWLGQVSINHLNPDGAINYINCTGTTIAGFEANGCAGNTNNFVVTDNNPTAGLPTSGSTVQVDSGNFFTDTFTASVNWFTESTGLRYISDMVKAPSNFLKAIGTPPEMAFAIGAIWYAFTFFLIVAFIIGRNT